MKRHYHNGIKTFWLLCLMWAILIAFGYILARASGYFIFMPLFALIAVGQTAYSYWNSDKLAIRSMDAYEVTPQQAPDLYEIVQELSSIAGQPMPRIYIAPTMSPNAFATGRNPQHAAVCCTEGILNLLDRRELRGVLGHELSHVYNRDILTGSIAAGMAGIISSVGTMFMYFGTSSRNRNERDNGAVAMGLVMAIVAPLAAGLVRLAVSRTREYDADEDGASLTGDPLALASALKKLSGGVPNYPMPREPQVENLSAMMIANPFGNLEQVMSTHPPMDKRIARLEHMAGY